MKVLIVNSKPYDEVKVYEISTTSFPHKADFIIAIGGDAAVLKCVKYAEYDIPVIAVNEGTLGFLSNDNTLENLIDEYLNGKLVYEKRQLFRFSHNDRIYFALNEIVVLGAESGKIVNVELSINNEYLTTYKGDGLIVSTPSGSTAWSLSAGGSIVSPRVKCMLVTPSNPFSMNHKPLILDQYNRIGIKGIDKVVVDGNTIVYTDNIVITTASKSLVLMTDPRVSFYDRTSKLGWGNTIKN
jgi:NAD+ kinase